jgi:hypothetical protein
MIHTAGSCRSRRAAFVDGVHVPRAFYADTGAGFVRYHLEPLRANKRGDAVRWAKKRGRVEVYSLIDPSLPKLIDDAPSYFEWAAAR